MDRSGTLLIAGLLFCLLITTCIQAESISKIEESVQEIRLTMEN